jgi:hypothetical protein
MTFRSLTELAGHLNAANYRWLRLIAEFDRRNGWSDGALQSCAHWLNFKCGLNLGAAREKVRVAHALESLPRIAAAGPRPHPGRGGGDRGIPCDASLVKMLENSEGEPLDVGRKTRVIPPAGIIGWCTRAASP